MGCRDLYAMHKCFVDCVAGMFYQKEQARPARSCDQPLWHTTLS